MGGSCSCRQVLAGSCSCRQVACGARDSGVLRSRQRRAVQEAGPIIRATCCQRLTQSHRCSRGSLACSHHRPPASLTPSYLQPPRFVLRILRPSPLCSCGWRAARDAESKPPQRRAPPAVRLDAPFPPSLARSTALSDPLLCPRCTPAPVLRLLTRHPTCPRGYTACCRTLPCALARPVQCM